MLGFLVKLTDSPEDVGPADIEALRAAGISDQAIEDELEGLRHRVNELDDRRAELRDELVGQLGEVVALARHLRVEGLRTWFPSEGRLSPDRRTVPARGAAPPRWFPSPQGRFPGFAEAEESRC